MTIASRRTDAAVKRYEDAYRVGRAIVSIGSVIKIVGFLLAVAMLVLGLVAGTGGTAITGSGRVAVASLITAVLAASVVGLLFWLLGVAVSGLGQVLLASLDAAVNTSPFLSDEHRAFIMALPTDVEPALAVAAGAGSTSSPTVEPRVRIQPGERTITCPECGTVNPAASYYCGKCRRNLHM